MSVGGNELFCIHCGGQNPDDARFCHRCGLGTYRPPADNLRLLTPNGSEGHEQKRASASDLDELLNAPGSTITEPADGSTTNAGSQPDGICVNCSGVLVTEESLRLGKCRRCRGLGVPPALLASAGTNDGPSRASTTTDSHGHDSPISQSQAKPPPNPRPREQSMLEADQGHSHACRICTGPLVTAESLALGECRRCRGLGAPSEPSTHPSETFGSGKRNGQRSPGILKREAASLAAWLILVVQWFVFGLALALGYWLSDVAYAAGLWPIGALLRIGLVVGTVAWLLQTAMVAVAFFRLVLVGARRPSR